MAITKINEPSNRILNLFTDYNFKYTSDINDLINFKYKIDYQESNGTSWTTKDTFSRYPEPDGNITFDLRRYLSSKKDSDYFPTHYSLPNGLYTNPLLTDFRLLVSEQYAYQFPYGTFDASGNTLGSGVGTNGSKFYGLYDLKLTYTAPSDNIYPKFDIGSVVEVFDNSPTGSVDSINGIYTVLDLDTNYLVLNGIYDSGATYSTGSVIWADRRQVIDTSNSYTSSTFTSFGTCNEDASALIYTSLPDTNYNLRADSILLLPIINYHNMNVYVDGASALTYTYTYTVPETVATATVTIDDVGAVGDNVGIFLNDTELGRVTMTSGMDVVDLATALESDIYGNISGFGVSRNANTLTLSCPAGNGSLYNGVILLSNLVTTASTATTITGRTSAVATISGYTLPPEDLINIVSVNDAVYGNIVLAAFGHYETDLDIYTTGLVQSINFNPYGYVATQTSSNSFTLTAPLSNGASQNTLVATYVDAYTNTYTGTFAGGGNGTPTIVTTFHSILPTTITAFTGGTDEYLVTTGNTNSLLRYQIPSTATTVQITASNVTGLTDTKVFNIIDKCDVKFKKTTLYFFDRNGAFIPFYFDLVNNKSLEVTNTNWKGLNEYGRSIKRQINTQVNTKYQLTTDWLNEAENEVFEELFTSNHIYMDFEDSNTYQKVLITDKQLQKKKTSTEKLFNYQIVVELAKEEFVNQ